MSGSHHIPDTGGLPPEEMETKAQMRVMVLVIGGVPVEEAAEPASKRRDDVTRVPVTSIEMPLHPFGDLSEEIHTILEAHGCRVEEKEKSCILHFPPGTTKDEIWPRIHNSRYEVFLPGGPVLYEHELNVEYSTVRLPIELFSQETQKKYR